MKQTFFLLYVFFFTFNQAYAQSPDISVSSSNANSYLEGYTPLGQYYQLSYAHPLNRTFSLSGHLSTAQRSEGATDGQSIYTNNDIFSSVGLDVALRVHLINLQHHQLSVYAGGGIKRISSMDASRMGLPILNENDQYDHVSLYRLPGWAAESGYDSGIGSYWMASPYLAAEYIFYPTQQVGIGYTMRVRSHLDYFFEDASIGPVLRYRWAEDRLERTYTAASAGQIALQVIPTRLNQTDQFATQIRTQYQHSVANRWALAGAITYTQGSHFPEQWTPESVPTFFQYQSTAVTVSGGYHLVTDHNHQLTALVGPAYRWAAYANASGLVNAFDPRENRLYYDPTLQPNDYPHLMGDFTTVQVDRQRGWGGGAQLNYSYRVTSTLGLGGVLDYQQYSQDETLVGAGLTASLHF